MRTTAHIAKPASTSKAGLFAALGGLRHAPGTGVPARSSVVVGVASLCALAVGLLFATPALALPEGRHYEMVSPPYKVGYGVAAHGIEAVAVDGESVAFSSLGAFAGAPAITQAFGYEARRKDGVGWSTTPMMPPATLMANVFGRDVSSDLGLTIASGKAGPTEEGAFQTGTEAELLVHSTDMPDSEVASWQRAGGLQLKTTEAKSTFLAQYVGASGDLCHVVFEPQGALLLEASVEGQIYELVRGCNNETPSLRLIAAKNELDGNGQHEAFNPTCHVRMGGETGAFNAVAAGGKIIFFTTGVAKTFGQCVEHRQVFVRLDGSKTLEVSRPMASCVGEGTSTVGEVPCEGAAQRAGADFVGASRDGTRVFFTTTEQLKPEDSDNNNDLYMATIGCPQGKEGCEVAQREVTGLVQVSHDSNTGQSAEVKGVVRVAPDGSRVYFVASGDLLTSAQQASLEGEAPVPHVGADNLYVYDASSGTTTFVGDLCSESERSGVVEDTRCPANLTSTGERNDSLLWERGEAQTAGEDGRFLVFATYARLSKDDTDSAKDIYRYDSQTGALDRLSIGEAGYHANGNSDTFDATIAPGHWGGHVAFQYEMDNRAVSEDGSRVVFRTAEPLSPAAVNGLENVYEWHEGSVSLISTGSAEEPVNDVVISPSGRDIFFETVQGIVPSDIDGANDIYDARIGGGFPVSVAERQPCSGDACQGPLTNPAPLLVPGSVSQAPGENDPPSSKAMPKKLTRAQQLARALKACAKKPKSRRAACRRSAQKKYGKAARSAGRSGR